MYYTTRAREGVGAINPVGASERKKVFENKSDEYDTYLVDYTITALVYSKYGTVVVPL